VQLVDQEHYQFREQECVSISHFDQQCCSLGPNRQILFPELIENLPEADIPLKGDMQIVMLKRGLWGEKGCLGNPC
jgi:hypothetical protein